MIISTSADEKELRQCLEPVVAELLGGRSPITAIRPGWFDLAATYDPHLAWVHLTGNRGLTVYVKDFCAAFCPKAAPKQRCEREVRTYRDLLEGSGLATPRYYGAVMDDARGRFWLILEPVGGTPLAYCAFERWVEAARRLAQLHGHFAPHANLVRACDFLLHHDADFFWSTARLALHAVSMTSDVLADRLSNALSSYDQCVELMASQPATLVHGSYKPRHVLVDVNAEPPRFCPVDWELAGAGSGLYDLAFLTSGFRGPRLDQLLDAYRHEALAQGLALPGPEAMRRVVDCFRLHRKLKALAGAETRDLPDGADSKLVASAERLVALIS